MKKIIILIFLSLFIIGCIEEPVPLEESTPDVGSAVQEPAVEEPLPDSEPIVEEPVVQEVDLSCSVTADCELGKDCIAGQCKLVADLYDTDCETTCTYKDVVVKTSDGETYTLPRGKGSYTGAGALNWKLLGGPRYCETDSPPIPIHLSKFNAGKMLSEEVIVMKEGETSAVITHPTVKRISFTVTLESLNQECS